MSSRESTGHAFEQQMNLLQALQKGWEDGKVMVVNKLVEKDSRIPNIFLTPDFSIAGILEDTSTSSIVEELFHSEPEKLADLIGSPQNKDEMIRKVLSEQSVVDNTKPRQEECLVVENEAGITVILQYINLEILIFN